MTLPSDLPGAMAMLADLIHDERLLYGLATVVVVLVASGFAAALILAAWVRR